MKDNTHTAVPIELKSQKGNFCSLWFILFREKVTYGSLFYSCCLINLSRNLVPVKINVIVNFVSYISSLYLSTFYSRAYYMETLLYLANFAASSHL